jgi:hypothetical protein
LTQLALWQKQFSAGVFVVAHPIEATTTSIDSAARTRIRFRMASLLGLSPPYSQPLSLGERITRYRRKKAHRRNAPTANEPGRFGVSVGVV